ncbi:MAG TPA: response regulator [Thermoanaerobaculia bacterium]|jgi:two-component system LytT family response regulator
MKAGGMNAGGINAGGINGRAIQALIVDDEPIARLGVRRMLEAAPGFEVCGECGDGAEAVRQIRETSPDVVFLDVQMPELDGISVVRSVISSIGAEQMPLVVFVTAYDQYAVRAFDLHALDYVVKPFDKARFRDCLERVQQQLATTAKADLAQRLGRLLDSEATPRRLLVRDGERMVLIPFAEIDWLEAADNYVRIHRGTESILHRRTVDAMEELLGPAEFVRIRRSIIVRIDRIRELHPLFRGEYILTLAGGARLRSSRRYRGPIEALGVQ